MAASSQKFIAPATRAEAVATHLRQEIARGELGPGAPIRDAEIAKRLGVSITPVREAIAVLISEGLVDVLPNKRRQVMTMTQQQAEELMDVLGVVMSAGVRRIDPQAQDLSQLQALMRSVGQQMADPQRRETEPRPVTQLLDEILRLTGNSELKFLASQLSTRIAGRLTLYPYGHFAPMWGEAFEEVADTLPDTESAARRISDFFARLVAAMSAERDPDEVITAL